MDRDNIGPAGEQLAADYLVEMGWDIVERNFRNRLGELDIIAERWVTRGEAMIRLIAVVEVKTRRRRKNSPPSANVTFRKRRKIVALGRSYLKLKKIRNVRVRFDVIAIGWQDDGRHKIHHLVRAFDAHGRSR